MKERPRLREALAHIGDEDMEVVWKRGRLKQEEGRGIDIFNRIGRDVEQLQSLSDEIDTTTAGGELVLHNMGALAGSEPYLIGEGTWEGLRATRRRRKPLGRPSDLTKEQVYHAIARVESTRRTVPGRTSLLGCDRKTVERSIERVKNKHYGVTHA